MRLARLGLVRSAFQQCDAEQHEGRGNERDKQRSARGQIGYQDGGASAERAERIEREHRSALSPTEVGQAMSGMVLSRAW